MQDNSEALSRLLEPIALPTERILILHVRLKGILSNTEEEKRPTSQVCYSQLSRDILTVIGDLFKPRGILVPTFTYSFTKTGKYDRTSTPSEVGRFGEEIRQSFPPESRTLDPVFSVIDCNGILDPLNISAKSAFGPNSLWQRLGETGHVCVNLNLPHAIITTYLHFLESKYSVPYRYSKLFAGQVSTDGCTWQDVNYEYYVRDIDRDTNWRRNKIASLLRENKAFYDNGETPVSVRWFDSTGMDAVVGEALKNDPEFLITD